MMQVRYLEQFAALCSDEPFGQEAVEWAVLSGRFPLTYHRETDLNRMMGVGSSRCDDRTAQRAVPTLSKSPREYDRVVDAYQAELQAQTAALVNSYAPLLEQIQTFPVQTPMLLKAV